MTRLIFWVISAILVMGSVPAPGVERLDVRGWEALWTRVLARHVDRQGRIDFGGLRQDRGDLDRVVEFVAAADPASQPQRFPSRDARLAFHINAYNALAMQGVLDAGVPRSLGGLTKVTFFYLRRFTVGGRSTSLHGFENDVIRPLGEARIHFALNCMVVSCPKLPRTAFTAGSLDRELESAARAFINEARNVRVDPARRVVWLSGLFDFYTDDFLARAPSLIAYVNRYRAEPIASDFKVRFLDYDWTVNDSGRIGKR